MIKNSLQVILVALLLVLTASFKISNSIPYNVKSSTDYAYFSGLAYCPKKCLEGWSCKAGLPWKIIDVTYINNDITLASCFAAYKKTRMK